MRFTLSFGLVFITLTLAGCTIGDGDGSDAAAGSEDGGSQVASEAGHGGSAGAGGNSTGQSDASTPIDAGPAPTSDASTMLDAGSAPEPTDAVPDPAPDVTATGEYGCDGCPDSDMTEFEIDATETTQVLQGMVTGAVGNGEFYLESSDGQSIGGAIPTSDGGAYNIEVPLFCGTQLLKLVWVNDTGRYVAVVQVTTTDCVDADIRLTLTWDDLGFDYELHLIKEGGRINDPMTDCTWTTCIGSSPDWGVMADATDDPHKDVDNTGNFGPENIYYPMPEDGTYTVMIEHWGAGMPDSDGQVTINLLGQDPVVVDITNLVSHHVFTAATIEWPSRTVTPVETDYDCTMTWAGGCTAEIP